MHICIFFHFTPGIIWTLSGNLTKGCCYILHLDGERFQYLILISVYIVQLATLSLAPFIYEFSFYVLSIFIIDNFLFLALWSYWMWFLLEKKKKKRKRIFLCFTECHFSFFHSIGNKFLMRISFFTVNTLPYMVFFWPPLKL